MGKIHPTTPERWNLRLSDLLESQKQASVLAQNLAWSHDFFTKKRQEITLRGVLNLQTENIQIMMSVYFSAFFDPHYSQLTQGVWRPWIWDFELEHSWGFYFFSFEYPTARTQCTYFHFSLHTTCHPLLSLELAFRWLLVLLFTFLYPSYYMCKKAPNSSVGAKPGP